MSKMVSRSWRYFCDGKEVQIKRFQAYGSAMVSSKGEGSSWRWCPSHRKHEWNPPGRLRCSLAWRDFYAQERDIELAKINPLALIADVLKQISQVEQPQRRGYPEPPIAQKPKITGGVQLD